MQWEHELVETVEYILGSNRDACYAARGAFGTTSTAFMSGIGVDGEYENWPLFPNDACGGVLL
jgi:hypothetical protein